MKNTWEFYGRAEPLAELRRIVSAGRWFFCRIEGRRRIGKTALLGRLAQQDPALASRLIYMQVPDSDERDVAYTFSRSLRGSEHQVAQALAENASNFAGMAFAIGKLCELGFIVVLDEFQYFTRAKLSPFNSFLQAEVDRLRSAQLRKGGLFVLGSLQSEMSALLQDKGAPLYGRVTAQIRLDHWDFEDLMELFASHDMSDPKHWLTLWAFFEGVPKFYHDAYEQGLLGPGIKDLGEECLRKMFIKSSSPLAEEADTWFLRELRGKSVSILHFLADHAGCSHGDLVTALSSDENHALGTQLARLVEHYKMVDKLQPVFSEAKSRNARYYIADNFLQAWLAVAKPAREDARLRPLEKVLPLARRRLEVLEGQAFEKLIRLLHTEASRKGRGDFELSALQLGYWNRPKDFAKSIEIDLVALDQPNRRVRFGSCKRSPAQHQPEIFEPHVDAFLQTHAKRHLKDWKKEMVLFSPEFSEGDRKHYHSKGYIARDLNDFAQMFGRG